MYLSFFHFYIYPFMGIDGGWTEAKSTNVVTQELIGPRLKGRIGCLDLSCLLHYLFDQCCSATRVKDTVTGLMVLVGVFDQTKLRGLCINFIMNLMRRIESRLIVVFDGPDPPGKSRVRAVRNAAVAAAKVALEELRTDETCGEGTFTKVFRRTLRWDPSGSGWSTASSRSSGARSPGLCLTSSSTPK